MAAHWLIYPNLIKLQVLENITVGCQRASCEVWGTSAMAFLDVLVWLLGIKTSTDGTTVNGSGGHLGHVTVSFQSPKESPYEFNWPSGFREDFWKCWQDRWRTNAGVTGILLAHQWALGSGELKTLKKIMKLQPVIDANMLRKKWILWFPYSL